MSTFEELAAAQTIYRTFLAIPNQVEAMEYYAQHTREIDSVINARFDAQYDPVERFLSSSNFEEGMENFEADKPKILAHFLKTSPTIKKWRKENNATE